MIRKVSLLSFFLAGFLHLNAQVMQSATTYLMDTGDTMTVSNNLRQVQPLPNPLACASTNNLLCPYNTNNGQRGIMFDVTALNNITINCFDVNLATGTTNVEIYYKIGTHVGFTTTPGAWTLIGSASVAGLGTNIATYVPVAVNVAIQAGCTVAFYITRTTVNGAIVNYTNGTAVGFVFASNADMQVKDGTGKDYPFGASFTPRRFNGTIYYNVNSASSSGTITGPTSLCAGATANYTYNGNGWTTYTWTVPVGTTISSGQGTQNITITAGPNAGNICCTPSGACGPGQQVCLAVTLAASPTSTQSHTNVSCFGGTTGSATVTPNPAGAYTYTWNPNVGSTATVNNLAAGTYTVTVSNAGGCTTTQTITITQPTVLSATQSHVDVLCNGASTGSATVNPSGGAGGYTYVWSPSGGNAATANNLSATNYSCTITDANGCTNTQTFALTSPSAITIATSSTPSVCGSPNGSATATPSGGAGGYTYSWSSGGTASTENNLTGGSYTCTVTDANGCTQQAVVNVAGASTPSVTVTSSTNILCNGNSTGSATVTPAGGQGPYTYAWSSGGSAATENNLPAGSYTCTITDANGCTASSSVTLTEPTLLTSSLTSVDVLCNGGATGSATMTPNGGANGYVYVWSPSGGNAPVANNLTAQSYTCTVTDANGCTTSQSVTITEPTALTSTVSQVDELCSGGNNGSATVNPSGGAGGYTYTWNPSGGNAATAPNITAGSYTCTITDANGCILTESFTITEPATVVASQGAVTNVGCFGQSTGVINVNQSGGTSPYTYTWSPNVSAANSASNLAAGSYSITVTDANGCANTVTITITEPTQLTVAPNANPAAICSGQPVVLTANAAGGTTAYTITWNPGNMPGNSQNVSPSTTTTYTVDVTDANGCTANATTLVTVNPNPTAAVSSNIQSGCDPVCVNFTDMSTVANPGVISAWTWDFGDGNTATTQNPTHCYTTPGVYTVVLTAKTTDGCISTVTMNNYISDFVNPVADFSSSPQPTSIVNPEIFFTDMSTNASQWLWSFGDVNNSSSTLQNPSFIYGQPTCFNVLLTATSQDGCVDTTTHIVCIDADVAIYVPNAFTPNGNGLNETFLPIGIGLDNGEFQMWIFDRWGNMIYYTTDINQGWDGTVQNAGGKLCQEDTYVWKIFATDQNGVNHSLIGGVNLIR